MQALVLEQAHSITLRDSDLPLAVGPRAVKIRIHTVGICGSDVHYFKHGKIGPFAVEAPMVLGHEASGVVAEVGDDVTHLKVGDRVCMEPGVPQFDSPATMRGLYNLDPAVRFWATPPIHGCLTPYVVHPAAFTFKLPDNVSFGEGAIVEPLAIGLQAAKKAAIKPGDVAVVIGAGTIGAMNALAALAGGCSRVILADLVPEKLALFAGNPAVTTVDVRHASLADTVRELTDGWAPTSSSRPAAACAPTQHRRPAVPERLPGAGRHAARNVPFDIVAIQAKKCASNPCSATRTSSRARSPCWLPARSTSNPSFRAPSALPTACGVRGSGPGHPRDVKIQIELAGG